MDIGLDLEKYWTESPKQFKKRVEWYQEHEKNRIKEIDMLNHMLGKYIGFAVNDPKKYPEHPFTYEAPVMGVEQMQMMAKNITNKIKSQNKWQQQQ